MSEIQKGSLQYRDEVFGHHEKCLSFFEKVERGENIYVCIDGEIIGNGVSFGEEPINGFSQTNTVSFSILNDEMISYDKEMIGLEVRKNLIDEYKPFFCGFNAQLELDNLDIVQSMQGNWFEGRFVSEEAEYISDGKTFMLEGFLQTSASPINSKKGRLLIFKDISFKKTVLDQINSVYNHRRFTCASNANIQMELDSAWGDCIPKTIDIYNVGHGNCNYIRGDGRRILYDVGYNYPMVPKLCETKFPRAVKAMRQMKPSVFKSLIEFMHVPHHCSKMELTKLKKINPSVKGEYAIVSTNRNKDGSKNCDNAHQVEVKKRFKNLIFTMDNGTKDDNRNLSVVIDCCRKIANVR